MPQAKESIVYNKTAFEADNGGSASIVPSDFWGAPVIKRQDGSKYCPGFVGETFSKNMWDLVLFGGILKTPGIAEVKVAKSQDADVKEAKGKDGAKITAYGIRPAQITINIKIWTPDQLDELRGLWQQIMPRANQSKDQRPSVLDIYHPNLKVMEIKQAIVLRGEGMAAGSESKTKVFQIDCLEYIPPSSKGVNKPAKPVPPKPSYLDKGRESQGQAAARALTGSNPKNTGP